MHVEIIFFLLYKKMNIHFENGQNQQTRSKNISEIETDQNNAGEYDICHRKNENKLDFDDFSLILINLMKSICSHLFESEYSPHQASLHKYYPSANKQLNTAKLMRLNKTSQSQCPLTSNQNKNICVMTPFFIDTEIYLFISIQFF